MDAEHRPTAGLARLRSTCGAAALRFAQAIVDAPRNRPLLQPPAPREATALWQSALTLTFDLLHTGRLAHGGGQTPGSPSQGGPPPGMPSPGGPPPAVPTSLGAYHIPRAAGRRLVADITGLEAIPPVPAATRKCLRMAATNPEPLLERIYEGLAGRTAQIAVTEQCHVRHGQREVVVPAGVWDDAAHTAESPAALRCIRRIAPGELFLQSGFGRKAQGSYYTPRWLARHLAATTLAPLLEKAGEAPAPIRRLRILDPAMGSGALLAAARSVLGGHALVGDGSKRRPRPQWEKQITEHCLFGIDLDPVATHLARLALADGDGASGNSASADGDGAAGAGRSNIPGTLMTHLRTADALTDPQLEANSFDAVICNPPWEKSLPLAREFFAAHDPRVLTAPTGRERLRIQARLLEDPAVAAAWNQLREDWRRYHEELARRYRHQTVHLGGARGRRSKGHADLYRYFVERAHELCRPGGVVGLILPNSFYANEGATGIRRLLLEHSELLRVDGFHNGRRIFDAAAGLRFCLVFFRKGGATRSFPIRFGLSGPEDLASGATSATGGAGGADGAGELPTGGDGGADDATDSSARRARIADLRYRRSLLRRLAPEHLSFPECRSPAEVRLLETLYARARSFRRWTVERGIRLYQEMNMTHHAGRLEVTRQVLAAQFPGDAAAMAADVRTEPLRSRLHARGYLILHEKGTFRAYDDGVQDCPRYLCPANKLEDRPHVLAAAGCYRLAARATIHAGEAQKSAFCLLPPGVVVGNSALAEATPSSRATEHALLLLAIVNSGCFGFATRTRMSTNLNQFILGGLPIPPVEGWERFLVHGALRLSANHLAYAPLWHARMGGAPRSPRAGRPWPHLPAAARGRLRAALDAAVAFCYGLTEAQYAELLGTPSPASMRGPTRGRTRHAAGGIAPDLRGGQDLDPDLALSLFREILADGPERFRQREDLYQEQPLLEDAGQAADSTLPAR